MIKLSYNVKNNWKSKIIINYKALRCGELIFDGKSFIIGYKIGAISLIEVNFNGIDLNASTLKQLFKSGNHKLG